jgi:hypothetical protein
VLPHRDVVEEIGQKGVGKHIGTLHGLELPAGRKQVDGRGDAVVQDRELGQKVVGVGQAGADVDQTIEILLRLAFEAEQVESLGRFRQQHIVGAAQVERPLVGLTGRCLLQPQESEPRAQQLGQSRFARAGKPGQNLIGCVEVLGSQ